MNATKTIIASIVTAAVVMAIGLAFVPHSTVVQKVGGAPDLSNSPYLDINGYVEWFSQVAMAQGAATTTICSFQQPAASSTIDRVIVRFGGLTTSGLTFSVGTSTTAQGNGSGNLAMGLTAGTGTVYSLSVGQASSTLGSGNFVNVILSGLGTTTGGQCQAKYTQL